MNKELKKLIDNMSNKRVIYSLNYLIKQKDISDIIDLKNLLEKRQGLLFRTPGFGRKSFEYLHEKLYSMFTFKTKTYVTYVPVSKEIEIAESIGQ
jgi:hypothetical protein|tara:strand:+ start:438 stop:722 length:285 start_codon:yes stop_codon:yes gene_type:complete